MTTDPVSLPVFRNEHISISRAKRFEECAFAFYKQYVDRPEGAVRGRSEPAEFGVVVHDALERVYRGVIEDEYAGPFPEARLLETFRMAWAESGLVGVDLYTEGREMLRQYAQWSGPVDHMRVLAVEQEFNLLLGPGTCRLVDAAEKVPGGQAEGFYIVNGFIDRVDRVDSQTVEIIDYKSNRLLFSKEELAADLQVEAYAIVARLLYPWASRVELSFHMLRHGPLPQRTHRTARQLEATRDYLLALGQRTERGPYPATLNKNCGTCDWKDDCDTYKAALAKKPSLVVVSREDMETLAEERERVAAIAKAAYARKEQIDAILKGVLGERDSLELAGHVYRLLQYSNTEYRATELLELFAEVGVDLSGALAVDNKALEELLDKVEADESIPRLVRDFLRARCASRAVRHPQKPRIDSRVVKRR